MATSAFVLLGSGVARAASGDAHAVEPAPAAEPAAQPEPEPEPEPTPAVEAAVAEEEAEVAEAETAVAAEEAAVAVEEAEVAEEEAVEEAEAKWYDGVSVGAFVDAYIGMNLRFPEPYYGMNTGRAFDEANGFSFAWAGINTAWEGEKAAATIDLRFGPATNAGWADDRIPGIQLIKQAFVSWMPLEKLSFDLGRFDTIYGAEVAESWANHTYTRGFLYNLAQPFWHTGLRIKGTINDSFGITAMVVNGWGYVWDNNRGKGVGLQFAITPGDVVGLYIGYLGSPEADDLEYDDEGEVIGRIDGANRDFKHLVDVVLGVNKGRFGLAFNADYVYDQADDTQYFGGMLSARGQLHPKFALAGRVELLWDPDGYLLSQQDNVFGSETLTLEFMPSDMISIRLDGRHDWGVEDSFSDGSGGLATNQGTLTLGMAVHTF